MLRRLLWILLLLTVLVPDAFATRRGLLVQLRDQNVPMVAGQVPDMAAVDRAWVEALDGNHWKILDREEGRIHASLAVRNKHFIEVNIYYNQEKFSILYVTSNNMNYLIDHRGSMIHPSYMVWVQWLADGFVAHLTRPGFKDPIR